MAQFDVHRIDGGSFVVDCQSDSLAHLATHVVAPLLHTSEVPAPATRLHPVVMFGGEPYLLATHLLAAMPTRELGPAMASLDAERYTLLAALDMLLTGV
jgi:toxin CcdB